MANGTNRGGQRRGEVVGSVTVTCLECGQEVSKRNSLAVQGGRICKAHPSALRIAALNAARMRQGQSAVLLAA